MMQCALDGAHVPKPHSEGSKEPKVYVLTTFGPHPDRVLVRECIYCGALFRISGNKTG